MRREGPAVCRRRNLNDLMIWAIRLRMNLSHSFVHLSHEPFVFGVNSGNRIPTASMS